jgi:RNA polymerase sigma-70 factor (ECF subfamily)
MIKRTENETDTEDTTIETFAKALIKSLLTTPNMVLTPGLAIAKKNVHYWRLQKNLLFVDNKYHPNYANSIAE